MTTDTQHTAAASRLARAIHPEPRYDQNPDAGGPCAQQAALDNLHHEQQVVDTIRVIDAELGLPALIALLRRIEADYVEDHGEPVNHNVNPDGPPIGMMSGVHGLIIEIRDALARLEGETT